MGSFTPRFTSTIYFRLLLLLWLWILERILFHRSLRNRLQYMLYFIMKLYLLRTRFEIIKTKLAKSVFKKTFLLVTLRLLHGQKGNSLIVKLFPKPFILFNCIHWLQEVHLIQNICQVSFDLQFQMSWNRMLS